MTPQELDGLLAAGADEPLDLPPRDPDRPDRQRVLRIPMQQFAILSGLPGSGKSSLGKRLREVGGFFVVSSDGIRLALNAGGYPRGDQDGEYAILEPIVWDLVERAVTDLLRTGRNVAIDATN